MARDLLDDTSTDSETSSDADTPKLEINAEFARKFEHNKKREELQKLEEKHGRTSKKRKRDDDVENSETETSSESEDEDDFGELATAALDSEISATLNAIRSKDPRLYDGKTTFYTAADEDQAQPKDKADKPMYLRDYHRQNLLGGSRGEEDQPASYTQQQLQLRKSIVNEMNAVAGDSSGEDDLLVEKKRERPIKSAVVLDVENAERDPETFLSNFMASRAWVPTEKSTWQPLESDDEDEERRADAYEQAYNMRFEDPGQSNETLRTHARDVAARYSVRRDEKNARQKKREEERERIELEKQQKKEEKARLRKLRIEELEAKVQKIKNAAGLRTNDIRPEDWSHFVNEDWDDSRWEEEMQRRFDERYYAEKDGDSGDDSSSGKPGRPKKPKFEDDIDIVDIVPDFEAEAADFSLTEEEDTSRSRHKQRKEQKKRESKKERRIIEQLVDDQLQFELDGVLQAKSTGYRYRETSPQSFGLTARDILMADDSQLNQFAGLKKLATFRDPERKRKDRKHLGKKGRLREWRKATFGDENEPQETESMVANGELQVSEQIEDEMSNIQKVAKKRRRSKKRKAHIE